MITPIRLEGTEYKLRAYTTNATDTSLFSNLATALTIPATPKLRAPSASSGPNSFYIDWFPVSGATNYYLNIATDPNFGPATLSIYSNLSLGVAQEFKASDLEPGKTYYYQISASNLSGSSPFSEPAIAATKVVTDVNTEATSVDLYPNPGHTYAILKVHAPSPNQQIRFAMYDELGRKLLQGERDGMVEEQINCTEYPKGFYLMIINLGGTTKSLKFIIN